jgi:hypothetical protein
MTEIVEALGRRGNPGVAGMDAEQIRGLKPMLTRYLKRVGDCYARRDTRADLPLFVGGHLSDLPAKICEPIALAADVAPRTLQEFLSQHQWDNGRMRDRVQGLVASEHAGSNSMGIIDETSDVKKEERGQDSRRAASMVRPNREKRKLPGDRPFGIRDGRFPLPRGRRFVPASGP